jgi:type IV secretory pathway TrbD component
MPTRRINAIYKAVNKPLTILGAERRLFFSALILGGATFNLLGSLLSGFLIFIALLFFARWATGNDPELLRILLNSSKFKYQYDPAKFHDAPVEVIDHA